MFCLHAKFLKFADLGIEIRIEKIEKKKILKENSRDLLSVFDDNHCIMLTRFICKELYFLHEYFTKIHLIFSFLLY